MAINRPSISQLIARVYADIRTRLPGVDPQPRRSASGALGAAQAGLADGLHGHLEWLSRQILPDTAEAEWLERHAALSTPPITRKAASKATGSVVFTGGDGSTIPAATRIVASNGQEYVTDADGLIVSGSATVAVTAAVAGEAGDLAEGSQLTTVSAVPGIESTATVAAPGISGGEEIESDALLLLRLLQRRANPPQGGADADYLGWTTSIAGITRAWVRPNGLGLGTVLVYVIDDTNDPVTPDPAAVAAARAYIDTVRPVTADVTVSGPNVVALDMTIVITPDTGALREAVEAELATLFLRKSQPGATIYRADLVAAIQAAGVTTHTLNLPAADAVAPNQGDFPVLGAITWA